MANKEDGRRIVYKKPELTKLGNVVNVTFHSPEWNCSVGDSSSDSSWDQYSGDSCS